VVAKWREKGHESDILEIHSREAAGIDGRDVSLYPHISPIKTNRIPDQRAQLW
jgi:hypothetical protein